MLIVMRERRHANQVMLIFLAAQVFLCLSAWLLYFHVRLPWATSNMAQEKFAVFSSYLDQGIMSAVAAAVLWHLRTLAPSPVVHRLMVALSVVALGNVFLVFSGRTGHLVGIAMISLAIFWQLPKRFRLAAFVIPPVLFIAALAGFGKVGEGFEKARQEMSAYSGTPTAGSSVGMRLSFWKASVESIAAHPAFGTGVGSWLVQYEKFAPPRSDKERHGNPHQEFLLWGVQLGVGGIALLLVLLASLCRDFTRLESASARAGLSAVAALAISCLFNSTLYDAYIGDFFCITFAVLLGYGWLSRQTVVPAETTVSAKSA
ncbi:MAG: O-antigen ligase family protein [Pseudomonadota bacterium]